MHRRQIEGRPVSGLCCASAFKARGYVHIFDESTLDLIFGELDTITDFVDYLAERERMASLPSVQVLAEGEEQVLAMHKRSSFAGSKWFDPPFGGDIVVFPDGRWQRFVESPEYRAREEANGVSYAWDRLIESFTAHILSDRNTSPFGGGLPPIARQEEAIRQMAAERRVRRRQLARWMFEGADIARDRPRFARTLIMHDETPRGYVLVFMKPLPGQGYAEYRRQRLTLLQGHVYACKLDFPEVQRIVGIASEGNTNGVGTEDLLMLDCKVWTEQDEADARNQISILQIGDDPASTVSWTGSDSEFPSSRA